MTPQFAANRAGVLDWRNIASGLYLFAIGLFKKVVLADSLAPTVTLGFDEARSLDLVAAWTVSLAYSLQLYFDFKGYTDMAIGSARMFNIDLPQNFDSPYKAVSIQDFWRRWHITLSRFLRDYLYIPGGSRASEPATLRNLFLTFLLGGIRHGAGWTFVAWGALHGAAMAAHRLWRRAGPTMPAWLGWLITFNFVNVAWVFFRAESFQDALKVLRGMAGLSGVVLPGPLAGPLAFLQGLGVSSAGPSTPWATSPLLLVFVLALLAIALLARTRRPWSPTSAPAPERRSSPPDCPWPRSSFSSGRRNSSTSTSRTRVDPMHRRFFRTYALAGAVFALPFVLNAAFVIRAGETMTYAEVAARQQQARALYGSAFNQNNFRYKLELVRQRRPAVIALGSSRVMTFREESFRTSFATAAGP